MNIVIRNAVREDMSAVYDMVYGLAVYEKEPEAVTTTVETFEKVFDEKLVDVHIAECDGKVVGMSLFYMTFSTWKGKCLYLEDFYVLPEYRKFGIGQKLFDVFLEEAKKQGATMTKWQVLDWNEPALSFYKKNAATIEKNWWNGKIFLK